MSSVTQKSAEGLPIFYLKDIPPIATRQSPDNRAAHLFGQGSPGYVIVKTSTPEFDYPKAKDNALCALRWRGRHSHWCDRLEGPVRLAYGGTSTSCSATTSPARAGSCFIATSRIAWGRSRRSFSSIAALSGDQCRAASTGYRTPHDERLVPYAKPEPTAAISTTSAIQ